MTQPTPLGERSATGRGPGSLNVPVAGARRAGSTGSEFQPSDVGVRYSGSIRSTTRVLSVTTSVDTTAGWRVSPK